VIDSEGGGEGGQAPVSTPVGVQGDFSWPADPDPSPPGGSMKDYYLQKVPELQRKTRARQGLVEEVSKVAAQLDLPFVADQFRHNVHVLARSAGFSVLPNNLSSENRPYNLDPEPIVAMKGLGIWMEGQVLSQFDLTVWEALLFTARSQGLEDEVGFLLGTLLTKTIGVTDSGKSRKAVLDSIARLQRNRFIIERDERWRFTGSLVGACVQDKQTDRFHLRLGRELATLFQPGEYSPLDWEVRKSLRKSQMAQWLLTFYSSHGFSTEFAFHLDRLAALSGLLTRDPYRRRQAVRNGLTELGKASDHFGLQVRFEIDKKNLVHARRPRGRPSDRRLRASIV
jgi:hypothetical protein